MSSFKKSIHVHNIPLLSQQANTTKPCQLAESVRLTDPKLSNLLSLLPADATVLDVWKEWSVKEYNAQGPVLYVHDLYIYYAHKEGPLYTHHAYSVYTNRGEGGGEAYCLDPQKPRRLSRQSPMYDRLIVFCKENSNIVSTHNPFALLSQESDSE